MVSSVAPSQSSTFYAYLITKIGDCNLNGRKDGDREGNFTCIANGSRSVVNYVLVNTRIYDSINSFHVITHTESDLFPMT